jgi:predicted MFS family arabinose efflux permease
MVLPFLRNYLNSFRNLSFEIWLLALGMFINRSGTMVLMFASLYLTRDKGFSMEQAGFIMAFYGAGSILGSLLGGWLTDRWRPLPVMLLSLALSGLVLLFLPSADSAWVITTLIFLNALVADMYRPANSAAMSFASGPHNRTRSVSLVRLATNLGFSIGPAAGGFFALWFGYSALFYLDAITSLLACLVIFLSFRKKIGSISSPYPKSIKEGSATYPSAYRDGTYLAFIFLVAIYGICFFQLFAGMPQYFKTECGFSEDTIGLLLALNGFVVVLTEMPVIAWLESHKAPFYLIMAGVLFIPVSLLFLLFGNELILPAVVYTVLISFSEILAMPFMMNFTLNRGGGKRQGQYAGLYSIAYGIANIAAPSLGLFIASDFGFRNYFQFFILLSLANAAGFYLLQRKMSRKPE